MNPYSDNIVSLPRSLKLPRLSIFSLDWAAGVVLAKCALAVRDRSQTHLVAGAACDEDPEKARVRATSELFERFAYLQLRRMADRRETVSVKSVDSGITHKMPVARLLGDRDDKADAHGAEPLFQDSSGFALSADRDLARRSAHQDAPERLLQRLLLAGEVGRHRRSCASVPETLGDLNHSRWIIAATSFGSCAMVEARDRSTGFRACGTAFRPSFESAARHALTESVQAIDVQRLHDPTVAAPSPRALRRLLHGSFNFPELTRPRPSFVSWKGLLEYFGLTSVEAQMELHTSECDFFVPRVQLFGQRVLIRRLDAAFRTGAFG